MNGVIMQVITRKNGDQGIYLKKHGKHGVYVSMQRSHIHQDFLTGKKETIVTTRNEYWKIKDLEQVFQDALTA